jgi:hypothetical protein
MTLSARDRRIITAIEQDLEHDDPPWARRFARRHRRFRRLERRRLHPTRRYVWCTVGVVVWVIALFVDDLQGPGPWLWAGLGVSAAAIIAGGTRRWVHKRRYGGGPAERRAAPG